MKAVFCLPLAVIAALAQQGASPLEVTGSPDPAATDTLDVSVRNISAMPIRAWVINVTFSSPTNGSALGHVVRSSVKALQAGKPTFLGAGQAMQHQKQIPVPRDASGALARADISVDSVIFADGSTWGPGSLPESVKTKGMVAAMDRGMTPK